MTDRFGPGDAVVVRHLKRGRADVEYPGTIASDDGELVVVSATWTTEIDIGCARFERDDQSTEHYWRTRWYGIWETRTSEGQLKGWYCNISRPLVVDGNTLCTEDLDLDLWISAPPRTIVRLDEDEFEASGLLTRDPAAASAAWSAMIELEAMSPVEFGQLLHVGDGGRQ